jgi:hypothetical protein
MTSNPEPSTAPAARKVLTLTRPRRPPIETFFFCWSPSRRRPRERHRDRAAAIAEAERLAALHVGTDFFVYEARVITRKVQP